MGGGGGGGWARGMGVYGPEVWVCVGQRDGVGGRLEWFGAEWTTHWCSAHACSAVGHCVLHFLVE